MSVIGLGIYPYLDKSFFEATNSKIRNTFKLINVQTLIHTETIEDFSYH